MNMEIIDLRESSERDKPEIWLLRHGKTSHNQPDEIATFAGSRVNSPLSEEGAKQTEQFAKDLVKKTAFDSVITSKMKRAVQTGQIIAQKIKNITGQNIEQKQIDDFQEIDTGYFTGLTESEARKLDPDAAAAFYESRFEELDFPNGENNQDLQSRIDRVIRELKKIKNGNRTILVGHGMFNRVLLYKLFPSKPEIWGNRDYPHCKVIVINV